MDAKARHTAIIKRIAADLGFEAYGIAKSRYLEEEAPRLENWLDNNYHGKMGYMANHFDKRLDPQKLVPGAKSVVSLLYNYYPQQDLAQQHGYKLAKYAYGQDYHDVTKRKLREFLEFQTECSVESAIPKGLWEILSGQRRVGNPISRGQR